MFQPPWKLTLIVMLAMIILVCLARAEKRNAYFAIQLSDITEIQNPRDKPCKPEMEMKPTIQHPEGEPVPNGWTDCEKVRIKFKALVVIQAPESSQK